MKKGSFLSLALVFVMVVSSLAFAATSTADAASFSTTKRVSGVKLSVQSSSSIKISWSKYSYAKGYKIYRATKKTGTYKLIKTTTARSYTSKSLKAKTRYYYKVRAYKVVNKKIRYSKYSYIKSAVTKAKPTPQPVSPTCKFTIHNSDGTERTCTMACKSGSEYCAAHTCGKDGCYDSVYSLNGVTYEYCTNHICKFLVRDEQGKSRYCGTLCAEGSKCCETHSCSVEGCNETVMSNGTAVSIYCANHGCKLVRQGEYCTKSVFKNGYCKDHLCPVCEKMMKTEGSDFCSCCRCTVKGCDNERIDGAEGNDRGLAFQCCKEHQCNYVRPDWDELTKGRSDSEKLALAKQYGVDENGRCVGAKRPGLEFCNKHLCQGCFNMAPTPGYHYCTCCRCTYYDCDNARLGGSKGGEFGYTCCTEHQCLDVDESLAGQSGRDAQGRCVEAADVAGHGYCYDHMSKE